MLYNYSRPAASMEGREVLTIEEAVARNNGSHAVFKVGNHITDHHGFHGEYVYTPGRNVDPNRCLLLTNGKYSAGGFHTVALKDVITAAYHLNGEYVLEFQLPDPETLDADDTFSKNVILENHGSAAFDVFKCPVLDLVGRWTMREFINKRLPKDATLVNSLTRHPEFIRHLEDFSQPANLVTVFVKHNPDYIILVPKDMVTEDTCLAVVRMPNFTSSHFEHLPHKTPAVVSEALAKNPRCVRFLTKPPATKEQWREAVARDGMVIMYYPPHMCSDTGYEDDCIVAINENLSAFHYIHNPTKRVIQAVVKKYPFHLRELTPSQCDLFRGYSVNENDLESDGEVD